MPQITAAFLVNKQNEPCFLQVGEPVRIAAIRITARSYITLSLRDGAEEMLTDQLDPRILDAMSGKTTILVAHMTEDKQLLEEYFAPITFSP